MIPTKTIFSFAALVLPQLVLPQLLTSGAETRSCDVLVYGATPAGIMAAISAAENGQATILITPYRYVGGVMTSGLCATDMNSHRLIGGRARKFFQRVYSYYQTPNV